MSETVQRATRVTVALYAIAGLLWLGVCALKIRSTHGPRVDPYTFYPALAAAVGFLSAAALNTLGLMKKRKTSAEVF